MYKGIIYKYTSNDCSIDRSLSKLYLNRKDNCIHGKFIWKIKYE